MDPGRNEAQALCTCPTRELVVQVSSAELAKPLTPAQQRQAAFLGLHEQNVSVLQRMAKFTSIRSTSTALDGTRRHPITEQVCVCLPLIVTACQS